MTKMSTPLRLIRPPDCPEDPTIDVLTPRELDLLVMYRAIPYLDVAQLVQGLELIEGARTRLHAGYSGSEVFQSLMTTLSDLIEQC
jgi:hypothetical protein